MRILFLLDNLNEYSGANIGLTLQIAKEIRARGNYVCSLCWDSVDLDEEKQLFFDKTWLINKKQVHYAVSTDVFKKKSRLRLIQVIRNPKIILVWLLAKVNSARLKRGIKDILSKNSIDAIITITNPFYMAEVLSQIDTAAKKIIIEYDAYTNNATLDIDLKERRRIKEAKVISNTDRVFAMSSHYKELVNDIPDQAFHIKEMEMPVIYKKNIDFSKRITKGDRVRFVYTGMLYENIRNPLYLLELFKYLPDNYELHIAGHGCEEIINKYKGILGHKLKYYGLMSSLKAEELLYSGTILINLNNSIKNQLPSKLFECINTGYPFLNICKRNDCPSLKYTSKYNNCINVFETSAIIDNAKKIEEFVFNNSGVVDQEEILKSFYKNTVYYAADQVLETISSNE